jgi:hypothetical protein
MTVLKRTIKAYIKGDHDDDVVWTNLAYPLAALGCSSPLAAGVVSGAGIMLAIASGAYHAAYTDYTQKLDTVSMMGYLASVTGSLLYPWLGAVLAPAAYAVYWTTETDSQVHVPAWSALALSVVAVKAGWWAMVPLALFVSAGALQLTTDSDSWLHSLWHVLGAAAAGVGLYLV